MIKSLTRILIVLTISSFFISPAKTFFPVTGTNHSETISASPVDSLADFSANIENGKKTQLVGVYTEAHFALPIVQQPASNPAFVSTETEKATEFSMARQYGSLGLVAHNNLAGSHFFDLEKGETVTLIYGDGRQADYTICDIEHYQALSPSSPYSKYIDLDNPGKSMDVDTVFKTIYGVKDRLVLQTCIASGKIDSWGRLFVIAMPITTGCDDDSPILAAK
jgi:hypothetical protein